MVHNSGRRTTPKLPETDFHVMLKEFLVLVRMQLRLPPWNHCGKKRVRSCSLLQIKIIFNFKSSERKSYRSQVLRCLLLRILKRKMCFGTILSTSYLKSLLKGAASPSHFPAKNPHPKSTSNSPRSSSWSPTTMMEWR